MTNLDLNEKLQEAKSKLGEQTTKLEQKVSDLWEEFSPNYTNLEPWKRGLILIGICLLLALSTYYLTHESEDYKAKKKLKAEQIQEERILRRMEVLKRLRE
jgi:hypothetical protein